MKIIKFGNREYVQRHDAICVLLMDGNDNYLLVKQDRAVFGQQFEIPAGKIESNETPYEAAKREVLEETGYDVTDLTYIGVYYPSVEYTTETIYCYFAFVEGKQKKQKLDDGEKIDLVWVSNEEMIDLIEGGKIKDSKTILAYYKFNFPLDSLRA